MRILIVVMTTFLFLGGCAQETTLMKSGFKVGTEQTARNRSMLVGHWYGDMRAADGGRHQWLNERKDDGSFVIRVRSSSEGETVEQAEYGSWGVSANIYFTMTSGFMNNGLPNPTDPTDPALYDAYEIVSISSNSMTYRSIETGNVYTARRVDEDFQFPAE